MSKVTVTQEKEEFRPVTVSIKLDTQDELDALYCVFNYTPISSFLNANGIRGDAIHAELSRFSGEYRDLFNDLERKLR